MVKLSAKDFITQLDVLYQKAPGSIFITFKHFSGLYSVKKSGKGPMKSIKGVPSTGAPMVIIHATDGNKQKLSTIISSKEVVSFQIALDKIMRKNMTGFKKQ